MGIFFQQPVALFFLLFIITAGYTSDDPLLKDNKDQFKTEQVALVLKKPAPSVEVVFSKEFKIAPNPVTKSSLNCNFYLNPIQKGDAELRIFDLSGNEIFYYHSSVKQYGCDQGKPFFSWNMKNRTGRTIGTGTYLAIITLKCDNGTIRTFKSKIGFKEKE
ncbi:MAG TPA: hypothetical protein VHO70_08410 [Chitinispirillaceae bacterium]|nr:hypothetical protein [Chitinispirillaceae bacterium]